MQDLASAGSRQLVSKRQSNPLLRYIPILTYILYLFTALPDFRPTQIYMR